MIPYDDLVAALSAWRARQGLAVNQLAGQGSGPAPAPGSGPNAKPGSGPNRAPPGPPPSSSRPGMAAAPLDTEPLEVADELLDEEAYENEGNDFAMPFNAPAPEADAGAPERPTETDMGNDRDDW